MGSILKDHLEKLHEVLKRQDSKRSAIASTYILDVCSFALSAPGNEQSFCSSLLFNDDYGVLRFLKLTSALKEFDSVKADILQFLVKYCHVENNRSVSQYLRAIKESCMSSFLCDHSVKVKTECINVICQLLVWDEKTCRDELTVEAMIHKFWTEFMKGKKAGGATLRAALYNLMGLFAERFPDLMMEKAERLIQLLLNFLKQEVEVATRNPEMLVISGCIRGLTGCLNHFTQSVSEGSKYAHNIYKYVKMCIMSQEFTRYDAPKATLNFLGFHSAQFRELLLSDAEPLYNALVAWSNHHNREIKYLAVDATDEILTQISICISEERRRGVIDRNGVLKNFILKFSQILNSSISTTREITMAIKGYGKFAPAFRESLNDEEMNTMFDEMLKRSEQCCVNVAESFEEENLYQLPIFLEALASIVKQLRQISSRHLYPVEKVIVILFDYYPQQNKKTQYYFLKGFTMFVEAISSSPMLFETCLSNIIYQCIIRTCSHALPLDEIQSEETTITEIKVSCKTFLPIWKSLLDEKNYKFDVFDDPENAVSIKEKVYDNIIQAILTVIKRLNLASEKKLLANGETMSRNFPDVNFPEQAFLLRPNDGCIDISNDVSSDPTSDVIAKMPNDFLVFVNLIDFSKDILCEYSVASFQRWILIVVQEFISSSSNYPIVSGFYKLLQVTCILIKRTGYFKNINESLNEESNKVFLMLKGFMEQVTVKLKQYKDELLYSCLQLVLSAPVEVAKEIIQPIIPTFQISFKLGLSYFELADMALCTLEQWSNDFSENDMETLLSQVLPCLNDYLQSSADTNDDVDELRAEGKVKLTTTERQFKKIPIRYLKALISASQQTIESPVMKLKLRIISFLGKLGGNKNVTIMREDNSALEKAIKWNTDRHLSFALPFPDLRPTIFLDSFYPQVIDLALTSSSRQVKVVACELLHALVLFTLGKSVQLPATSKEVHLEVLYRKVFPALIQLSCSTEQVAEQLFSPLVFQLIHWLTGNKKYESPETIALLDAILEGTTNTTDSSLRDFSAKCVKEFFQWSIKHSTVHQLEKNPANPKSLFKRLYSLALHPNAYKRLGAAVVFNNIYTVFREQESLVDVFTLEIFIHFMNSLAICHSDERCLGTTEQYECAIKHLERIITKKSKLLMKPNKLRHIPKELKIGSIDKESEDFNLGHINLWLFRKIGLPKTAFRNQCMQLIYSFLPLQFNTRSAKIWMSNTLEEKKASWFTRKFEGGGLNSSGLLRYPTIKDLIEEKPVMESIFVWMDYFIAALDCYCWAFRTKSLTPQQLFIDNGETNLFESLRYAFSHLIFADVNKLSEDFISGVTVFPADRTKFIRLKFTIVLSSYEFFAHTLNSQLWSSNELLKIYSETIFTRNFYKFFMCCVLSPSSVGFNVSLLDTSNVLKKQIKNLSTALLNNSLTREHSIKEFSVLLLEPSFDLMAFLPLDLSSTNGKLTCVDLMCLVAGYTLLHEVGLLREIIEAATYHNLHSQLVASLENSLIPLSGGEQASVAPLQKTLATEMLELALTLNTDSEALIKIFFDTNQVRIQGVQCFEARGLVFYSIFSKRFTKHLTVHPSVIEHLFTHGRHFSKQLANIVEDLLLYCSKDLDQTLDLKGICHHVVCHWKTLSSIMNTNVECKQSIISIAKLLVILSKDATPFFNFFVKILHEDTRDITLKSIIIEFLPNLLMNLAVQQEIQIERAISAVIVNHFPISSADLEVGSSRHVEYTNCLDKLLRALIASKSNVLFKSMVSLFIKETEEMFEKKLHPALTAFVTKLDATPLDVFFTYLFEIFNNESQHETSLRRGVAERIIVPALTIIPFTSMKEFFIKRMKLLTEIIDKKFTKSNEEELESQLSSKICCYKLFSILFRSATKDEIASPSAELVAAYTKPETGKELYSFLSKSALSAYKEDARGETMLLELRRQHRCAAYNCLISIISRIQTDLKFYTGLLFTDHPAKGLLVLENLVDARTVYTFESEISSPFARKKKLQLIRQNITSGNGNSTADYRTKGFKQYLTSQYLLTTSLSQDVNQFDFNNPIQAHSTYEPVTKIHGEMQQYAFNRKTPNAEDTYIEIADLNNHESMMDLLALMNHMKNNNIYVEPVDGAEAKDLPTWMQFFHNKMTSNDTDTNIKLFVAKIIINEPKIFEPFGKFWFKPLTAFILSGKIQGSPLNYFVIDMIVVMLSWSGTVIPEDDVCGRALASSLLDYLFRYSHHYNKAILKNNLQIIKTMLQVWKGRLEINYSIIHEQLKCEDTRTKDNLTGLQILGLVLVCGFAPYVQQTYISHSGYLTDLTRNLTFHYKDIYGCASEVCSLAMKYYRGDHSSSTMLNEMVQNHLVQFSRTSKDRFIECLYGMHLNYPEIVDLFVPQLLFCLTNLYGILKTRCIQCLATRIDSLLDDQQSIFEHIQGKQLDEMLADRDDETQLAGLTLIAGLFKSLSPEQICTVFRNVVRLESSPCVAVRGKLYELAMWLFDHYSSNDLMETESTSHTEILRTSKDVLLCGMSDTNTELSLRLLNFWQDGSMLPTKTIERLVQILRALYSTKIEKDFMSYVTNLMLQLTTLSPDYSRPVFDSGLGSDENFRNYHINFSWQRQNISMTPLFVATQHTHQGSYSLTQSDGADVGMLRETQRDIEFSQTNASSMNWMNPSLQITSQSFVPAESNTDGSDTASTNTSLYGLKSTFRRDSPELDSVDGFKKPTQETTCRILQLRRRFRKDKNYEKNKFAKMEIMRKKQRDVMRERQKLSRDRKVVMYRRYRVGELPDIQIKYSELIVPLQALAQLNNTIAQELFSALFSSITCQLPNALSETNETNVQNELKNALVSIMELSTGSNPSFTNAIENICLQNKDFYLEPQLVSNASITTAQEPVGILLLEEQLLRQPSAREPPRKRTRTLSRQESGDIRTWLEIAKLYESINDYDMLRSIFSSCISKVDITKTALSMEARNDYESALNIYKKASGKDDWDDSPTEEEEEYWDTARLRCYENLSMWSKLQRFTVESINLNNDDKQGTLDAMKIWQDDVLQDVYLPYYIKSNMKLLCQGRLQDVHGGFMKFIEDSLRDQDAKEHLQSRYSEDLALLNIFHDNFGGAEHYLNISNQAFLNDWAHPSQLIDTSRHNKLKKLQKVTEMREFIKLMTSADGKDEVQVSNLLTTWSRRLPSVKLHTTVDWDDIMLNRCSFIRTMKTNFQNNSVMLKKLDVGETHNVLTMAEIARKQGNFALANQYLRDSSITVFSEPVTDTNLSVKWRYAYAKIHCDKVKLSDRSVPQYVKALASSMNHLVECRRTSNKGPRENIEQKLIEYRVWNALSTCLNKCEHGDVVTIVQDHLISIPELGNISREKQKCLDELHEYELSALNQAVTSSNQLDGNCRVERKVQVKALMKLALFCDGRIKEENLDTLKKSQYADIVIRNILKAMKLNSQKARIYFPRLLQLIEDHPETRGVFSKQTAEIPSWMFIGWVSQIVALIDKPLQSSLVPILDNISKTYPQAIMYPLYVSSSQYNFSVDTGGRERKVYFDKLSQTVTSPLLETFARALHQLTNPPHAVKDAFDEIEDLVLSKDTVGVKLRCKRLFDELLTANTEPIGNVGRGRIAKEFSKEYGKKFEEFLGKDGQKLIGISEKSFHAIKKKCTDILQKELYKGSLKDFSPWLSNFHIDKYEDQLEIPGQYSGDRKPMLEYHVKIVRFDERVLTLRSMRQPKRLTICGNDEKEYKFLVKGGEDLRLDQRIEQVFELMNKIFQNDPICSKRKLSLESYKVIPLTNRVGIIEWVDNTETYEDFLSAADSNFKAQECECTKIHQLFLGKYNTIHQMYEQASSQEVRTFHQRKVGTVPHDLLRRAFSRFAASSEGYFVLRKHFVRSHACMCIAHYVLGIGDRHLSNMLINRKNGGVVGIDFGQSFGYATIVLNIPDLTPFRLTQQMLNFILPQDSSPYKLPMIVALQALRKNAAELLNTMDVFIKEPLLDWEKNAKIVEGRTRKRSGGAKGFDSIASHHHEKLKVCQMKLSGINPAYITSEELKQGHGHQSMSFVKVAKGDLSCNIRTKFLEKTEHPESFYLTVEEQVDCLVEQATDPNVLGRSYIGWQSWI